MIATVLCLSVLPTVLCAFACVYGLVFCIQSLINGEKMSESKQCRNMFLLAGAALEANGMTYANYKIRLEAELLDENQNAISGSNASDYLVYTNSRIYKNIIPRT